MALLSIVDVVVQFNGANPATGVNEFRWGFRLRDILILLYFEHSVYPVQLFSFL